MLMKKLKNQPLQIHVVLSRSPGQPIDGDFPSIPDGGKRPIPGPRIFFKSCV
jgi:hypothetical protein